MTEYVLDIETSSQDYEVQFGSGADRPWTKYFFTIDINGNVNISIQKLPINNANPNLEEYKKQNIVSINDNIPIPKYFIDIIKGLLQLNVGVAFTRFSTEFMVIKPWGININTPAPFYQHYWAIVINTIIKIKQEINKVIENPQDNLDIITQLDAYISKTKLQQENIVELEKKIENIHTAYVDTSNDNKNLKDRIKQKDDKQVELECENKILLQELNNRKQLDEYNKKKEEKMEELEKERVWREYKLQKQNYNPL
jgi:antitoxin component of MazEF toxin-antitoxin module